MLEVVKGNKLDDIRGHILAVGLRVECLIITIKRLHGLEVCIADANDDDGHGELRAANNLIDGLVHITDDAIRDNNQDVELLVILIDLLRSDVLVDLVDDFSEVGRSIQLAIVDSALVALNDFVDAVDTWVEDITVEGETVTATVSVRRNRATKSVQVDLLV